MKSIEEISDELAILKEQILPEVEFLVAVVDLQNDIIKILYDKVKKSGIPVANIVFFGNIKTDIEELKNQEMYEKDHLDLQIVTQRKIIRFLANISMC